MASRLNWRSWLLLSVACISLTACQAPFSSQLESLQLPLASSVPAPVTPSPITSSLNDQSQQAEAASDQPVIMHLNPTAKSLGNTPRQSPTEASTTVTATTGEMTTDDTGMVPPLPTSRIQAVRTEGKSALSHALRKLQRIRLGKSPALTTQVNVAPVTNDASERKLTADASSEVFWAFDREDSLISERRSDVTVANEDAVPNTTPVDSLAYAQQQVAEIVQPAPLRTSQIHAEVMDDSFEQEAPWTTGPPTANHVPAPTVGYPIEESAAVDSSLIEFEPAQSLPAQSIGPQYTGPQYTGPQHVGPQHVAQPHQHQPTYSSDFGDIESGECLVGPSSGLPVGIVDCPTDGPATARETNFGSPGVPVDPCRLYPDEYLRDGGDREGHVAVRRDFTLTNLEPEDTIGHYDTLDGRVVVTPSNRVCIYSPRFAATRKVTSPLASEQRLAPRLADAPLMAITDELLQRSNQMHLNVSPQRHVKLQPPAVFRDQLPATVDSQALQLLVLDKDLSAHEDLRVMKTGIHKQSDKPMLAEYVAKAITWTHDKAVQIVVDGVQAQLESSSLAAEQLFSLGAGKPRMRVIKTASATDAVPGEIVEFALRFDNIGYQSIGNVTLVDNLTTRLEYIDGSAECTLDAEFFTDENDVESLTLRWEITDPLPAGQGGLIRFKCRVR